MAEILTESFCERCGTRYTFETPKERSTALSGVRVLGKGLRKLALTRASSLDEAISSAKADDERAAAARQLEAFHGTFHFCLSCRQYTCTDCWNEPAGVCLTCEPTPESQAAAGLEAALAAEAAAAAALRMGRPAPVDEGPRPEWPAEDRRPNVVALPEPDASWLEPSEPPFAAFVPNDVPVLEAAVAEGPTEAPNEDRAEESNLAVNPLLRAFQPGTSLDDAIAAYEAAVTSARRLEPAPEPVAAVERDMVVAPDVEAEPLAALEPEMAAAPEPQPVPGRPVAADQEAGGALEPIVAMVPEQEAMVAAAPEPEPVAAVSEPEHEPQLVAATAPASAPEPEPVTSHTPSEPVAATAPAPAFEPWVIASPQPAIAQPAPPVEPALRPAASAEPAGEPFLPQAPVGEDPRFAAWRIVAPEIAAATPPAPDAPPPFSGAGFAARLTGAGQAAHQTAGGPVQTATRVQPQSGAHACTSCGLSLSANARFCRRCGTRQG